MKKLLPILLFLLPLMMQGQDSAEFAPVGAKWWYTLQECSQVKPDHCEYRAITIESVGDTILKGKNAKILVKSETSCSDVHDTSYVYSDSGKVYWYKNILDEFTLLYDFNANAGDSWQTILTTDNDTCLETVTVDSINYEVINSDTLKKLYTTRGPIYEKLGRIEYLLPSPFSCMSGGGVTDCFYSWSYGLRCYTAPVLGAYQRWDSIPCDTSYTITSIKEQVNQTNPLKVYPTIVDNHLQIEVDCSSYRGEANYKVYDALGRLMEHGNLENCITSLNVKSFTKGVCIIQININNNIDSKLFIVK